MTRATASVAIALCALLFASVADGTPLRAGTCPSMCVCRHAAKRADCRDIPDWDLKMSDAQVVRIAPPLHRAQSGPLFLSRLDTFPKVQMLSVTNRSIVELIPGTLPFLQVLDLSHNKLSRFNERTFHHMPALRKLILEGNPISLKKGIPLLSSSSIRTLDLSHCGLSHIPTGSLDGIPVLTSLYLQGNPLKLEEGVPLIDRPSIQEIDLSLCKLTTIPRGSLDDLVNLRRLFLKGNELTTISFGEIPPSVYILDLSANRIRDAPLAVLAAMKNLTTLELANNPLRCTCSFISLLDRLSERNVIFEKMIMCAEPQKYAKVLWKDINESELCKDDIASDESNGTSSESSGGSTSYSLEKDENSYETDVHPEEENRILNQHAPPFLLNNLIQKPSKLQNMEENSIQSDQPYSNTSGEGSDYVNDAPATTPENHLNSEDTTEAVTDDLVVPDSTESEDNASRDESLPNHSEKSDDLIVAVAGDAATHENLIKKSQKDREPLESEKEQEEDLRKAPDVSVAVDEENAGAMDKYEDHSEDSSEDPESETFMKNADTIAMGKSMPGKEEPNPAHEGVETKTSGQSEAEPVVEEPVPLASRTEAETQNPLSESGNETIGSEEPQTIAPQPHEQSDEHQEAKSDENHSEPSVTPEDLHHDVIPVVVPASAEEVSTTTATHESGSTTEVETEEKSDSGGESGEGLSLSHDSATHEGSSHDEVTETSHEVAVTHDTSEVSTKSHEDSETVSTSAEKNGSMGSVEYGSMGSVEYGSTGSVEYGSTGSVEYGTTPALEEFPKEHASENVDSRTESSEESIALIPNTESEGNTLEKHSHESENPAPTQISQEIESHHTSGENELDVEEAISSSSESTKDKSDSGTADHESLKLENEDAVETDVHSHTSDKSEVDSVSKKSEVKSQETVEEEEESVVKHVAPVDAEVESIVTEAEATHRPVEEETQPEEAVPQTVAPSIVDSSHENVVIHDTTTTTTESGVNFPFNIPGDKSKDTSVSQPSGDSVSEHSQDLAAESNMARISDSEDPPTVTKSEDEGDTHTATLAYALIGGLVLCIIIAVACVSLRTRSDNKRNGAAPVRIRGEIISPGTEMKDMMNPLLGPIAEGQTANEFHDDPARRSSMTSIELGPENGKFPVISPVSKENGVSSDKRKKEGSDVRPANGPHDEAEKQPLNHSSFKPLSSEEPDNVTEVVIETPPGAKKSPPLSHRNGHSAPVNGKPPRLNGTSASKVKVKEGIIPPAIPRTPVLIPQVNKFNGES